MECNATATAEKKKALLLHLAGLEVQEVYFDDPKHNDAPPDGSDVYKQTVELLDKHFAPIVCIPHERALFRKMTQKDGEGVTRFTRRLRHQANLCDYGNALDMRLTEQIFDGCSSQALRKAILKKRLVDLANIIEEGRVQETIESNQMEAVGEESTNVNKVRSAANRCFRCGSAGHYANDKKCLARKKSCDKCGLIGHFKNLCKTKKPTGEKKKKVHQVEGSEEEVLSDSENEVSGCDSDGSDIYHIFSNVMREKKKCNFGNDDKYNTKIKCLVGGVPVHWTIDSGASVNVIDEDGKS